MSSEALTRCRRVGPEVIDQHRAIVSLMEELEAVDWYNERAKATGNADLRAILEHHPDEEKEHAAMALEWLRRSNPPVAASKTFLFTQGPITGIEATMEEKAAARLTWRQRRRQPGHPARARQSRWASHGQREGAKWRPSFRDRAPITEPAGRRSRKRPSARCAACWARVAWSSSGAAGLGRPDVEPGRADPISSPPSGPDVQARLPRVQPLVELRIPFEVARAELAATDRGARIPILIGDRGGRRSPSPKTARSSTATRPRISTAFAKRRRRRRCRSAPAMPTIPAPCRPRSPTCVTRASKAPSPWS